MKTFKYTRPDGMLIEVRLDPTRPRGISRLQHRGLAADGSAWAPETWYNVTDEARVNMSHDCPEILQALQAIADHEDAPQRIRNAIIAQVDHLQMTSNAIYAAILGNVELEPVSARHINDYLARRSDMAGERLDSLLTVLGLTVKPV